MIGIGQIITSMLQKASVTGSRSTVLNPLSWMVALIITGLLTALSLSCPSWMLIVFIILLENRIMYSGFVVVTIITTISAFLYI